MPVHAMTKAASSIIGKPATGSHARCSDCGYGTVLDSCGAAIIVHAASCPQRCSDLYVACDSRECRRVLDPARVSNGAKTCDDRCRAAAWKARHNYGRHDAQGVSGRANGSQARKKPSGIQVSHRKAVHAVMAHLLAAARLPADASWEESTAAMAVALTQAKEILRPALSERQRKQLEDRESERGSA